MFLKKCKHVLVLIDIDPGIGKVYQ